jgi:hypothetical protein
MSAALVEIIARLGKAGLEGTRGLFAALLSGVSTRLDSPQPPVRFGPLCQLGWITKQQLNSNSHSGRSPLFIIIITRFSCLEARCVSRQAAVKAAKMLPLLDSPDPSKTQSTVGTVLSIYTAPRQPGQSPLYTLKKSACMYSLLSLS